MIDPKLIRKDPEGVRKALQDRHCNEELLDSFLKLDIHWRRIKEKMDSKINERKKSSPKGKPSPELLAKLKLLSEEIRLLQEEVSVLESSIKDIALQMPNLPDKSVPIGSDESLNEEIKRHGDIPAFSFTPLPHDELAEKNELLDFDLGAKISGSRFVVHKDKGAKLERALIQFMIDTHTKNHGYSEYMLPFLINSHSLIGTGQLPKFSNDCFKINDTDYWLSPTAEVQLTNLYSDTIIEESELPIYMTAHTSCFRKEAGAYGKDVKGIIRQHQFNKVELVQLVSPSKSAQALETLLSHAEEILKLLKLPYRVVNLCTGDLGFSSSKTYDIEVWFPSQNKYREISSCSNFLDFQSRRAMIRYRSSECGSAYYLHTLNGSGLAVGRTFAAILENYQCSDGKIKCPEVLKKYLQSEFI